MFANRHISVVIPAHNEEDAIGSVLLDLAALVNPDDGSSLIDDVVVCNNASTDDTQEVASRIANRFGWRVVSESQPGYGSACHRALSALRVSSQPGDLVVFVDGDCSVRIDELPQLIKPIICGGDMVIGNRVKSRRQPRALRLAQIAGNWIASSLIRLLWRTRVSDLGPFRAITREALEKISMQDRRFGWTVEMQVRAIQLNMTVNEVPVTTLARVGESKISGTVRGVALAGHDILGTIFKLYFAEKRKVKTTPDGAWENSG